MKKSTYFLISALAFTLIWISPVSKINAQVNMDKQITIQTRYMIPLSPSERDVLRGMLKEYFDKVTSKNEFIVHQLNMTHHYTDDSREFVTINEYANWGDIDKANDRTAELEKQAWPDEKKRDEFLGKLNSYFTHHKDGVFHELTDLEK